MCEWEAFPEALFLIDDQTNEGQRQAILTLLGGKACGPSAIVGKTLTKIHGPRFVPYQLKLDGEHTRLQAGNNIEVEMEPIIVLEPGRGRAQGAFW